MDSEGGRTELAVYSRPSKLDSASMGGRNRAMHMTLLVCILALSACVKGVLPLSMLTATAGLVSTLLNGFVLTPRQTAQTDWLSHLKRQPLQAF